PPNRQSNLSADAEAREPGIGARYVPKTIVEIECAEVWRQISNYLDDDVDPGLRANMSSHFNNCAHCSASLDGARNVGKLGGDGGVLEIPAGAMQMFGKEFEEAMGTVGKGYVEGYSMACE